MKLFLIWPLFLILAACVTASNNEADKVGIVTELTQSCKYIRMQNCESRRENGERHCNRRLKELAAEAGADTVLVDEVIDYSQIIQLDNNAFGDKRTVIETRLYQCNLSQEK